MPVESKITCATSVENQKKIDALREEFEMTNSKITHRLLTTILSLQPNIIWQLESAKSILGYDIIEDINKLITERKEKLMG